MTSPSFVRNNRMMTKERPPIVPFLLGCLVTYLATYNSNSNADVVTTTSLAAKKKNSNNKEPVFKDPQWWKEGMTQKVETLYETPFARFQVHTVKLENGKVIDDWMWFDEGNHINVLVEKENPENPDWPPTYLVMKQTKYGLKGNSLAVVGGFMQPNEQPVDAAKRELLEELGLESDNWVPLGSYRVAVNRGGGTIHGFLARKCTKAASVEKDADGLVVDESEKQELVELSREQLIDALLKGKFQEVKWTAIIALSMLKILTH